MSKLSDLAIKKLAMRKVAADNDRLAAIGASGIAGHLAGRAAAGLPRYRNAKTNLVNSVRNGINNTFDAYGQALKDIPETAEVLSDPNTYKGMYYNARDRFNSKINSIKQFGQNFWDVINDRPMNAYAAPDPSTKAYLDNLKNRPSPVIDEPWHKKLRDNLRYGLDVLRGRRSY